MPEVHLKQLGSTYSISDPSIKNKEKIQNFMQTENTNHTYRNNLDKTCFQHDMDYGKYKDLNKRTKSNKVLTEKAFKIASNPNIMDMKGDYL